MSRARRWVRRFLADERGQALYETAILVFLFLVMMIGVVMFGPLVYTRLATDAASYDCVTAAVEAVSSEGQGCYQGRTAAWQTLQGFRLNPSHASIYIWSDGAWGRGARMVCRVDYDLHLSGLPGASAFFPGSDQVVSSRTALMVEQFKSDWW
jgi:Flp pilus assembly pilin Flp